LNIAPENQNSVLGTFTEEIMNGTIVSNNDASRMFDSFASLHEEKLRWPLMYIGCICKLFSSSQACLSIGTLVVELSTYAATIESGKDWEVIITVATLLRYLWIVYRRIPPDDFSILPNDFAIGITPKVVSISSPLPKLEDVQTFVENYYSKIDVPTILVVSLSFNRFPNFDLLVFFNSVNGLICDGYQMKSGRTAPKRHLPQGLRKGFLFRGWAADWEYLSHDQIKMFLGYSLCPFVVGELRQRMMIFHEVK
jgi:hypothetical protein